MNDSTKPEVIEPPAGAAPATADGGATAAPEPASQAGAAAPPPAEIPPSAPPEPGHAEGEHRCEKCGKGFATTAGMHGHRRWCLRKADPPARKKISSAFDAAPQPSVGEPASVDDAVQAAAAALDGVGDDATTAEVLGKLAKGGIGVAELIALACYRALPPKLEEAEYRALRGVWSDSQIELPQWAMQLLVTLAIIGPRAMAHPWLGPQIRALFVPTSPAPKAPAAVHPPAPQAPPPPTAPPPQPATTASAPAVTTRTAADLTPQERAAWDV